MSPVCSSSHNGSMHAPASLRVAMINLGCVRNTVDSQNILGRLEHRGHQLTVPEQADVVIVNTCSFIEEARRESIDTILSLAALKKQGKIKKIIVAGCLAQRYGKDLVKELPEVDAFVGVQMLGANKLQAQSLLTPPHYAYLKICESCYNKCSFCIIPKLKGRFVSRTKESLAQDAGRLASRGVKELNIVGQDITAYGLDLYGKRALADLLAQILAEAPAIAWVRLLYAYPANITDALIDIIAREPRICKYIDVPLQHINDRILKAMNRGIDRESTEELVAKLRARIPGVFLRTTFIVGFPGETESEFQELLQFVKDHPFERVGVFTYSREENTPAGEMQGQVSARVTAQRRDELMALQQDISEEFQQTFIGRSIRVLVEERVPDSMSSYVGRSEYDAPDVDGAVYIKSARSLRPGDMVDVKITGAMHYDLEGVVL